MNILMIGDIVGKPGRDVIARVLPELRRERRIDFVVANAENAAGGSGLTSVFYRELLKAGIDCITLGDHAFRQREIFGILETERNILRPGNFPPEAPGRGLTILSAKGATGNRVQIAVMTLLGRVFMQPINCPFHTIDDLLGEIKSREPDTKIILLDFHAEATSDKQLMGRLLDGRVSAVLGTHTHVATADECILPGGTAFQCDVGMCGPFESILGRRIDRVMETVLTLRPARFDVASRDVRLNGTLVTVDPETGRATEIERIVEPAP